MIRFTLESKLAERLKKCRENKNHLLINTANFLLRDRQKN
jgi:hypothetical protein